MISMEGEGVDSFDHTFCIFTAATNGPVATLALHLVWERSNVQLWEARAQELNTEGDSTQLSDWSPEGLGLTGGALGALWGREFYFTLLTAALRWGTRPGSLHAHLTSHPSLPTTPYHIAYT